MPPSGLLNWVSGAGLPRWLRSTPSLCSVCADCSPCWPWAFCLSQAASPPSARSSRIDRKIPSKSTDSNPMWGGRFAGGPAQLMREINSSINTDQRLWREDIAAGRAHAGCLARRGSAPGGCAAIDAAWRQSPRRSRSRSRKDPALGYPHACRAAWRSKSAKRGTAAPRSRSDHVATDLKLSCAARSTTSKLLDAFEDAIRRAGTCCDVMRLQHCIGPAGHASHTCWPIGVLARAPDRLRGRARPTNARSARRAGGRLSDRPRGDGAALGFDPPLQRLDSCRRPLFHRRLLAAAAVARSSVAWPREWSSGRRAFRSAPARCWVYRSSISTTQSDAADLIRGHSARSSAIWSVAMLLTAASGYAKDFHDDKAPLFDAHTCLPSLARWRGSPSAVNASRSRRCRGRQPPPRRLRRARQHALAVPRAHLSSFGHCGREPKAWASTSLASTSPRHHPRIGERGACGELESSARRAIAGGTAPDG